MKAILTIDESSTLAACDPACKRLASVLLGQLRSAGISEIHCEMEMESPVCAQPTEPETPKARKSRKDA